MNSLPLCPYTNARSLHPKSVVCWWALMASPLLSVTSLPLGSDTGSTLSTLGALNGESHWRCNASGLWPWRPVSCLHLSRLDGVSSSLSPRLPCVLIRACSDHERSRRRSLQIICIYSSGIISGRSGNGHPGTIQSHARTDHARTEQRQILEGHDHS